MQCIGEEEEDGTEDWAKKQIETKGLNFERDWLRATSISTSFEVLTVSFCSPLDHRGLRF